MADKRLAYAEEMVHTFRKIVGVVLLSWQRILRVGLFAAALALIATEVIACLLVSSFPPPATAHLVAVALAFAVGYGAALTTLFVMLLLGGVRFIRHLEGDAAVGARAAAAFARREVGDVGAGLRRPFARSRARPLNASTRPISKPRVVVSARAAAAPAAAVGLDGAGNMVPRSASVSTPLAMPMRGEPPGSRRDPDDAIIKAPAPALQSLPVLASRLPRIAWSYDERLSQPEPQLASQPIALPVAAAGPPAALAEQLAPTHTAPAEERPASVSAPEPTASPKAEVTDTPVELRGTPDVPGLIPRGWYRNGNGTSDGNGSVTRPLPAVTRPLPAVTRPLSAAHGPRPPGGVRSGGLWERVSQALVGQQGSAETAETAESVEASHSASSADAVSPDRAMAESGFTDDAWLNG